MSLYLRFPDYQLASRRWARVEVFTQDVSSGIGECYNDPSNLVTADCNPWLQGGLLVPVATAAPSAGMIGSDGGEIMYCGIPVYNGDSLHAIIKSTSYDDVVWNIRLYTRAENDPTFSSRPDFWGVIDTSEITGDVMSWTNDAMNRYKLVARNRIALLERVKVQDWITGHLPYNTPGFEIAPAKIMIDGYQLKNLFYQIPGSEDWNAWPSSYVRFVSVKKVLRSISDAIGLARPVNWYDLIRSTWIFHGTDQNGTPTTHTADDLVIVSGVRTPSYWYWHYTFFDWETLGDISFFNVGDLMQVLKQILVPLGLQAAVETHERTGEGYLEVREVELASGVVIRNILRGASIEPGEHSARGFRVVIASDGEFSVNGTGDQSIDCCFMSATRIRAGERWTHLSGGQPAQDTDDIPCLMGSLYVYDWQNNIVSNVTGITVKSDGRSGALVTPPGVTLGLGGKGIGQAAAAYYYNTQGTIVSHLGIFRPAMERITFRAFDFRDEQYGTTTHFATGKLICTGAFPLDADVYLHRRVRNDDTGDEAIITYKDSDDVLALSADIFPSIGDGFVILPPRVGEFAETKDGRRWIIRSLSKHAREGTFDYEAERESEWL